ncbi:uncharacterized protein LOC119640009 [Glossina fuscipes]|uniref:Uncharacterized protein LOC119640009 n=1 Tax=Glossina fuscipes TaxID=7396 RepID=A0A9C5Z1U0_9MUSC|nr:uncharacterized protein LOC119640009 [Glossina fuscipes]
MSTEFCQDKDLLQINMEIIAKELCDLIVTAEQEARPENAQATNLEHVSFPMPPHEPIPMPMPANSWLYNTCYKQHQNGVTNGFQNVYFNQFYHSPPSCQANTFHTSGPTYFNDLYPTLREMPTSLINSIPCEQSSPECEIRYLPRNSFLSSIQSTPLISISAQPNGQCSHFNMQKHRKFSRNHSRNPKFRMETRDYSKIVVDFSKLGVSIDGKEPNQVLRLFRLLRGLHAAIGEIPPSPVACADSEYVDTFARPPPIEMPITMSVQHQVKYACRKLYGFISDTHCKLIENKVFDYPSYNENEHHLNYLRRLYEQLGKYKGIELQHNRGHFNGEDITTTENLEFLLQAINQKIREIHLRVASTDWFIGIKNRDPDLARAILGKDEMESNMSETNGILCNTTTLTT